LRSCYSLDSERIAVVPAGVSEHFRPVGDPDVLAGVRARYGLPEEFILFVATLEPRKNLVRLVEGYDWLRRETGCTLALVLAGGPGWRNEILFERIRALDLQECVLLPGFVDDDDLPALLSAALLFIYPSLYEGFGLPLEAMACGTPVVASAAGSLPEVLGTPPFAGPHDSVAIGKDRHLASDESLRHRLQQAGLDALPASAGPLPLNDSWRPTSLLPPSEAVSRAGNGQARSSGFHLGLSGTFLDQAMGEAASIPVTC
jgi:glycosyltransferase involved in cell wall biosynthesis